MWLKKSRTNALLEPLASVVDGQLVDGSVRGSYGAYDVAARPRTGFPLRQVSTSDAVRPAEVEMLELTLIGVSGRGFWRCQSSAGSVAQDLTSRMTAGRLLHGFRPGDFKFEGVDTFHEGTERLGAKLVKALGVPVAPSTDKDLQERLSAAGLFDALAALRWGPHPFLPKAEFTPPGSEYVQMYLRSPAVARVKPALNERLRAAGIADPASLISEHMGEEATRTPGRLSIEVEVGKARVPDAVRFRELLDGALRIVQINLQANPPSASP